jgi:hypothetical protein
MKTSKPFKESPLWARIAVVVVLVPVAMVALVVLGLLAKAVRWAWS